MNRTDTIANRFEVYPLVERKCGSLQPIHKTEYDRVRHLYNIRIRIQYAHRTKTNKKNKTEEEKIIKIKPK